MAFAEAASDDGSLTGRGKPLLRGIVCGLMTTAGGIGHTLPYLIPEFRTATAIAVVVVAIELLVISWIRKRYMDTPFSPRRISGNCRRSAGVSGWDLDRKLLTRRATRRSFRLGTMWSLLWPCSLDRRGQDERSRLQPSLGSTHSNEGASSAPSVASQNPADAPWLQSTWGANLKHENEKFN